MKAQELDAGPSRIAAPAVRLAAVPPQSAAPCIRVLVVTANQLFRESVARALEEVPGFEVVGTVAEPESAGAQIQWTRPTVTVIGPVGTGQLSLLAVRPLMAAAPFCRFVFLAERPTWTTVRQAADAGALGVVSLSAALPHLVTAIRGAAAGYLVVDRDALHCVEPPVRELSERERTVLRLTARGLPIKEIAAELFLSPGTVRNITSGLIKKLGGRNRHDAARLADEHGYL